MKGAVTKCAIISLQLFLASKLHAGDFFVDVNMIPLGPCIFIVFCPSWRYTAASFPFPVFDCIQNFLLRLGGKFITALWPRCTHVKTGKAKRLVKNVGSVLLWGSQIVPSIIHFKHVLGIILSRIIVQEPRWFCFHDFLLSTYFRLLRFVSNVLCP